MAAILPWIRENICQNEPFPLYGGWLSPCLQDVAIYLVLDIFLLVFGLYRIIHLRKHYEKVPDLPTTNIHLLKNSTHIFIIILVITEIAIHQFRGTWGPYYDIVKDVGNVIVWIFSVFVLHSEYRRGCRQNWILRTWWTLSFLGWSVTLKYAIDVGLPKVDFGLLIAEYTFVTLMCFVGLFFNRIPVVASQEDQTHYGTFAGSNLSRKYEMCDDDEMEGEEDSGGPTRELSANFISKSLFWWMNGLLKLGFKRPLQQADLQDLHPDDEANALSREFQEIWEKERQEKKPSIKRALRKFVQKKFFFTGFFKFGNDVFVFTGPLVLNGILSFLSNNDPMWVVWTCGLFLGSCLQSLFSNQYFFRGYRIGMHMRNALIAAVYQKSFKLSNSARQQSTTGEIVNLQAIDSQKMADLMPFLHMVWSAPFQIGVAITWLIFILGPSALAGLGVMVLLIPFNVLLARKQGKLQKEIMKIKDARAKRMNEILNGIRVVKFFVWEPSMSDSIQEIRTKELKLLRHSAYLRAGTIFLWTSTPLLVAVATFTAYTLTGHPLTPSVAFTSLALFNILRFPLNMLPNVISSMVEAGVSLGRIQTFLLNEELDTNATIFEKDHKNPALTMENGSFAWDKNKEKKSIQALDNVNFKVNQGELVAIIAPVGIGKSSLMAAMLGDMEKLNGTVKISGSVAYVSQQAWIQNATVRDNILFGREFDGDRYNATLEACELLPDIQVLPDGDMTEIGEKGINLSGGQKQRINCARAVYQMADIYLFDDPLSAVDAHVGRNLFNNCIKGMLQGKTRVLVTHQLQYLSEVDRILVLKETSYGGTVAEFGTYQELMARSNDFTKIIRDHVLKEQEKQERQEDNQPALTESSAETQFTNAQGANVNTSNTVNIKLEEEMPRKRKQKQIESPKDDEKAALKNTPKKLMTVEERRVGQIGATTYKQYLSAFPGGMAVGAIIILMFVCSQASSIGSNVWLAQWSDNAEEAEKKVFFYLGIYAAIGLSSPVFVIIRSFLVALCGLGAAKKFHEKMLGSAMRAPVSFFDTTPIGRILNRFTKDIADVDQMVPPTLMQFMEMAFSVLGIIVVISMATPWFLVPLVPLAYFYRYIQRYYVSSSRELKRLDSISKSPIFAHFSETLSGLSIIRAYKRVSVFVNENEHKLNENAKAYFTLFASNRWLGIRLEFIGYSVVTLAALFAVFSKGSINPGVAGLAMTYSLSLTALLNMAVRMSAEVENQLVSVERVMEYTSLTSEAPAESTRDVPEDWPSDGRIEFENVSMRYRPDLPLVLKHVSFTINPQEKVGIVGRTGSGKSSTVLALFRIVELLEGSVVIDGVDIRSLGLNDARSRLSIIPQDPVLFTGTVRSNVDPTESYSEPEIWKALESVHMKHAVEILPMKIDSPVTEAGENFSVGQRQLLCLARALLKRSKVIVMDEATAAVDMQTDSLIQNTIRTQFSGMTVITIAHRIHTILDYDKIAVMEAGEVVEFDSPKELLAQSNSLFSSLVRESQRS